MSTPLRNSKNRFRCESSKSRSRGRQRWRLGRGPTRTAPMIVRTPSILHVNNATYGKHRPRLKARKPLHHVRIILRHLGVCVYMVFAHRLSHVEEISRHLLRHAPKLGTQGLHAPLNTEVVGRMELAFCLQSRHIVASGVRRRCLPFS